jgi:hypothetical protein
MLNPIRARLKPNRQQSIIANRVPGVKKTKMI